MKNDCGFQLGNHWFRLRTGGILIHNDKMLFVECAAEPYYYMIGGGVHLGETTKETAEREVYEEAGIKAKAKNLSVICENFFKGHGDAVDGLDCHVIEFYYLMDIEDMSELKQRTDTGERLVWLTREEIKRSNIKPSFIKERIDEIIRAEGIIHMIHETDR